VEFSEISKISLFDDLENSFGRENTKLLQKKRKEMKSGRKMFAKSLGSCKSSNQGKKDPGRKET
jgi:hypothetical protein